MGHALAAGLPLLRGERSCFSAHSEFSTGINQSLLLRVELGAAVQTSPGGWLEGQRLRPHSRPPNEGLNVQFSGWHVCSRSWRSSVPGAVTLQLGLYSRGYQLHKTHRTLCLHEHEGGGGRRQGVAQLPGKEAGGSLG